MSQTQFLDGLHQHVKRSHLLQHFTAFTRILLALAFFTPGMVKVLGIPFTALGPETAVGYFFSAFHSADMWYRFVGLAQVTAAVLLLFPRTATLGAVLYFPIIVNIMFVTLAINFAGTKYITILMTLASLYLLCWDYDRLKGILPRRPERSGRRFGRLAAVYAFGFAAAGVAGFMVLASLRLANTQLMGTGGAVAAAVAGAIFGVVCAWHVRGIPDGRVGSGSAVRRDESAAAAPLNAPA